ALDRQPAGRHDRRGDGLRRARVSPPPTERPGGRGGRGTPSPPPGRESGRPRRGEDGGLLARRLLLLDEDRRRTGPRLRRGDHRTEPRRLAEWPFVGGGFLGGARTALRLGTSGGLP